MTEWLATQPTISRDGDPDGGREELRRVSDGDHRSVRSVAASEREAAVCSSARAVIPSERSESRDQHFAVKHRGARSSRAEIAEKRHAENGLGVEIAVHRARLLPIHDFKIFEGPVERSLRHAPRPPRAEAGRWLPWAHRSAPSAWKSLARPSQDRTAPARRSVPRPFLIPSFPAKSPFLESHSVHRHHRIELLDVLIR